MSDPCKATVDTSEGDEALRQLKQHADITAGSVMSTIRKSYSSMMLLADIMGVAIPEWFNLMSSAAIMAGQMFVELAAADTVSGIFAWRAGATFAMAAMMFARGMTLQAEQTVVESKLNSTIQLLNMWS